MPDADDVKWRRRVRAIAVRNGRLNRAAAFEAAFALGSIGSAERAMFLREGTLGRMMERRGIVDPPPAEHDPRREPGYADWMQHERNVRAVLLAVVHRAEGPQPGQGRYRMPPPSEEISDILRDCSRAAIAAAYPQLLGSPFDRYPRPLEPEEEALVRLRYVPAAAPQPLTVDELARAVELARRTGLSREDAIAWVRAARPVAAEPPS